MESDAPLGEKRRGNRRWRWIVLGLVILPIGLFLLSNIVLSSPWGCRWLAAKIERKIGLECRVGAMSWSPWNGLSIRAIEILQPKELRTAIQESVLKIAEVRLSPVWQAWLRGRLEVRSIALDTPRIVLAVELLSHLVKAPPPPAGATAASPPNIPAGPPPPPTPGIQPGSGTPPPPVPATQDAGTPPPPPKGPQQPTGWLHLENASFTLLHAGSKREIIDLSTLSGSIPIAGDRAQSTVQFGKISAGGVELIPHLTASLDWARPRLSLKPLDFEILGYTCKLAGQIGMLSNLPIVIEAQLPQQPLKPICLPLNGQASAEGIAANTRFSGLLLAPGTWQGDLVAESAAPAIRMADHEAKFDRGSFITVLRGGLLSCVDARLIGDELSLLGNATILADGRLAGVARAVAPTDTAGAIASRVFPNVPGTRPLTPLATPQRVAFDLEALGNINQIFLRLGKDGPVVNFNR